MSALPDDDAPVEATMSDAPLTPEARVERGQLMDAALKVMRRNGFQGASVQDILDHAGLSTRAFYRQFQSKDDLLLAMFRTASRPDVAQVAREVGDAKAAIDAVHVWIDEILAIAYDRKRIQRLVMFNVVARQTVGYSDDEAALRDGLIAPLLLALRQGLADGSFPTTDPLPDAHAIFDLVWSVASPHVRRQRPMDRPAARSHVLRFTLPALGVTQAG
ncbi:MAG TPA: TetR/AcrR family transcriptional regulator [Acidimicrobiales bacterium]|nr:TetR/AcrR family transcriptional regulator [Acidimicrobiales bacterium]